jgi:hypothetical protein
MTPCGYLIQMTADQREMWSEDANAYVADEEEETCTARVSGELLLDELCQVWEGGGGGGVNRRSESLLTCPLGCC